VSKILKHIVVKILGVVGCYVLRDIIVINDILPEDIFDGYGAYVCDGLHLNSFCEVLNCHNSEVVIALCWG
jgi:hypothetical protein